MYYCGKCSCFIFEIKNKICEEKEKKQPCVDVLLENLFHMICIPCLDIYEIY